MTLNNVLARTDGALFSGPTFNNTIWTDLTVDRDAGSPEWLPIYDDGDNVRFVARPDDLQRPAHRWGNRGWSICNTPPTRSPGGTPTCCSASPTGCGNSGATTCCPRRAGSRW